MPGEVFLGGACGGTTWRTDVAIPALDVAGITYVNPQLAHGAWTKAMEPSEMRAKAEARVLLFVIGGETRGVASVAEVAYYLAAGRALALSITDIPEGAVFDGKVVEKAERDDLNRGRVFIRTMAQERAVPVFDDIAGAVAHAVTLARAMESHLTADTLRSILADVVFRDATFETEELGAGFLVRLTCEVACADAAERRRLAGRPWFVSRDATRSEVVRTALAAVLAWQEHEARESFRYRGVPTFHPHADVDALTKIVARERRPDAGGAPAPEPLPAPLGIPEKE